MELTKIGMVLATAALALGLAACGDEEQDEQNNRELASAANQICDKFEKRFEDIDEPRNLRDTQDAAPYFDETAGVFEAAYIEFKALDPNDEKRRDWNAFLAKQREITDVSRRVADKTIKRDRSYINDLSELQSANREVNDLARRVGANGCAR
jgi:hypothetical protein